MGKSNEELYVCGECLNDTGLKTFVAANAEACGCSFCCKEGDHFIAAALDEVAQYIERCLFREYADANVELLFDKEEGSYFGCHWSTEALLTDEVGLGFPNDDQCDLLNRLIELLPPITWCEINGLGLNDYEVARFSWQKFYEVTTSERRFFFMDINRDRDDPEVYSPSDTLKAILEYAHKDGRVKTIPAGTIIYRARMEGPCAWFKTAVDLGPPPQDKATKANRMSPAGIVMFYGAEDSKTALHEIATEKGLYAVGKFVTLRPIVVLDLTNVSELPSLFEADPSTSEKRRMLTFLKHVSGQMSKPVVQDDREHIEYVPTQVVTEFIRTQMTSGDLPIDGIRYDSSVNPGHSSIVLFATQANIVDRSTSDIREEKWLKLVGVSHHFKFPALIGKVTKSLSRCNKRLYRLLRRRWYLLVLR